MFAYNGLAKTPLYIPRSGLTPVHWQKLNNLTYRLYVKITS